VKQVRDFLYRNRYVAGAATATGAVLTAGPALAVAPYDLTAASTGVTDQVQAAVTQGLPIMGGIIALGVGIKLIKRLVRG
jgi:hypothetical protein